MSKNEDLIKLIETLSNNYTTIISRYEIAKYPEINWGDNGIGDRFCKKIFNYTVIMNKKNSVRNIYKIYSENDEIISESLIDDFISHTNIKSQGIIGIFIHSLKINKINRNIRSDIKRFYKDKPCVVCGSTSEIVIDHKNDMYDDELVLDTKTQKLDDFQPLCNHCNLQKRQVCKKEKATNTLYSGINIPMIAIFKECLVNELDKTKTFWYDPIVYMKSIYNIITNLEKENTDLIKENKKLLNKIKQLENNKIILID